MTRQIRAANAAYIAAVARAAHPPLGGRARTLRDAQRACLAGLQLAAAVNRRRVERRGHVAGVGR